MVLQKNCGKDIFMVRKIDGWSGKTKHEIEELNDFGHTVIEQVEWASLL